jgi:hypothetical protein
VVYIESRAFTRRLQELAGVAAAEVLERIQGDLLEEPERGDMVRGLGGVRKARAMNPRRGKGKRGGFRYLYLYLKVKQHIHLLLLLDKDEQADFDEDQRREIRALVEQLKG